jgi:hypothetical protein
MLIADRIFDGVPTRFKLSEAGLLYGKEHYKPNQRITKPKDRISFQLKHNDKCLVASGEQSFLYLYLKDFLPKGKFQAITN